MHIYKKESTDSYIMHLIFRVLLGLTLARLQHQGGIHGHNYHAIQT